MDKGKARLSKLEEKKQEAPNTVKVSSSKAEILSGPQTERGKEREEQT